MIYIGAHSQISQDPSRESRPRRPSATATPSHSSTPSPTRSRRSSVTAATGSTARRGSRSTLIPAYDEDKRPIGTCDWRWVAKCMALFDILASFTQAGYTFFLMMASWRLVHEEDFPYLYQDVEALGKYVVITIFVWAMAEVMFAMVLLSATNELRIKERRVLCFVMVLLWLAWMLAGISLHFWVAFRVTEVGESQQIYGRLLYQGWFVVPVVQIILFFLVVPFCFQLRKDRPTLVNFSMHHHHNEKEKGGNKADEVNLAKSSIFSDVSSRSTTSRENLSSSTDHSMIPRQSLTSPLPPPQSTTEARRSADLRNSLGALMEQPPLDTNGAPRRSTAPQVPHAHRRSTAPALHRRSSAMHMHRRSSLARPVWRKSRTSFAQPRRSSAGSGLDVLAHRRESDTRRKTEDDIVPGAHRHSHNVKRITRGSIGQPHGEKKHGR